MDNFRGETKDNHPDIFAWTSRHPYEGNDKSANDADVHPVKDDIEATIQHLNKEFDIQPSEISAIGFCWGVWPIAKACSRGIPFKCAVGFHPSLRFEELFGGNILEMMTDATKIPTLYCVAGNDPDYLKQGGDVAVMLEASKQEGEEKTRPRCVEFPEMSHGWVSRGDTSLKKVKEDADGALRLASDFLMHWM